MRGAPAEDITLALSELGEIAEPNVALGPMTTYRVGGSADVFVRVRSIDDLHRVAAAQHRSGLPVLTIGRGSNLLVADAGFRGIAFSLAEFATEITIDHSSCRVRAGSAVVLPALARQLATAGLTGFEWAVGVPGSIGGAVRMNAGGHGSDMAASLVDVEIFDFCASSQLTIRADELGLRFRGSGLAPTSTVLTARLQLAQGDPEVAQRELSAIVAWRRANQPGGQNAGSVFVNPVPGEVSAGALIDGAGLRGLRYRSAVVSDKHANFIQADVGGCADDVRRLMEIVRTRVAESTGYRLRSEIRLIGFEEDVT
jgi:UDP-N-acetylmuramate dehydrogenase